MSRAEYRRMAREKMSESNLWLESAQATLATVYDCILMAGVFRDALQSRRVVGRERSELEMGLMRAEAEAEGGLRKLPSLIKTGRALRLASRDLEEKADDREWAQQKEDAYEP